MKSNFSGMAAVLAAAALWAGCSGDLDNGVVDAGIDSGVLEYDAGVVDAGPACAPGKDADEDDVCDDVDKCPGSDDNLDADHDTIPDACDRCENHDDRQDQDSDGVPDACDICLHGDDTVDGDGDLVPDHCDACPADASDDSDHDGVCDTADSCPGSDDRLDVDHDGIPDACDPLPHSAGTVDTDGDGVGDAVDQCPGAAEGWGLADQDLDNDLIGDGCDLCAGDNSRGDADRDGSCNIIGADDNCPGVSDFSEACPSTCTNGDVFSPECPDLPWRGGGGGNFAIRYNCPAGSYAVGIETSTYGSSSADQLGLKLICKDPMAGTFTYEGQYGNHGTFAPYELRCDQGYPDGRLIGNITAVHEESGNPPKYYLGRVGVICSSEQAGTSWRIEPTLPLGKFHVYSDVCTGANEVVTGLAVKTGWWCDGFLFSCSPDAVVP